MHLHGIVGLNWRDVGVIDFDWGLLVRRLSVAASILGSSGRAVHVLAAARRFAHRPLLHADQGLLRLVRNLHMKGRVLRLLEGIRHDECDVLSVVIHILVFKWRTTFTWPAHLFQRTRRP